MATKRNKKGIMTKAGDAVAGAAKTVAGVVDDYAVQPVGKALGLTKPKPTRAASAKGGRAAAKKKTAKGSSKAKRK